MTDSRRKSVGVGEGEDWVVPLQASEGDERVVGGKAAGLRALGNQFEVPPGFCVTTAAFDRVVDELAAGVRDLETFRERVRAVDLPEELVESVGEAVERIGADAWAVRSSAVEEDVEGASFAGQQRTELGVEGTEGILEAMRRVWADYFRLEGLVYRSRLRVDVVPGSMAVLVQAMVDVEVGGVMFTRPPEGDDESVVVDVASGTASAAVEGRGGAHYRLDRHSGEVRRVDAMGDAADEGTEAASLGRARRGELVSLARRIEERVGGPRDVEFAAGTVAGRSAESPRIWVLQQRPAEVGRSDEISVWTNANVGEALPGVATPMTWSIIGKFSRRGFERAFGTLGLDVPEASELVGSFRGRVYLNLGEFVSVASGVPILKPDVLFEMAGGGGLELVRDIAEDRPVGDFLRRLPATLVRVASSQLSMPVVAPIWSAYFDRRKRAVEDRDLASYEPDQLREVRDEVDRLFDRTGRITLTCSSNFLMSYVVMKKTLDWFGRGGAQRERELFGALDVESAEPVLDLLELGRRARRIDAVREVLDEVESDRVVEALVERAETSEEVAAFLESFDAFRREHGHRAPREAELATPRWREEPTFLVELLRQYVRREDLPTRAEHRARREAEHAELGELVEETFGTTLAPLARGILAWARGTARLRESMRSHVVETLDLYRRIFLACGRRLAENGRLDSPEDVFYLRYDELDAWLESGNGDFQAVRRLPLYVAVRRALVDRLREMPDPPSTFVLADGEIVDEAEYRRPTGQSPEKGAERGAENRREASAPSNVRTVLSGLPGRGGRVTGPARVVEDPDEAVDLQRGEILVAPHTDVGWTPLFMTASALVMELGGPLSHACIVAREFGIPTVVNARGATEQIASGDRLTVDGDAGVVHVHGSNGNSED